MRRLGVWAVGILMAVPAQAGQPISVSLAECGAIFSEVASQAASRGSKSRAELDLMLAAVQGFRSAAITQAKAEGRADPAGHIAAAEPALMAKWRGRMADITRFSDTKDWLDYCGSLGRKKGILPKAGQAATAP